MAEEWQANNLDKVLNIARSARPCQAIGGYTRLARPITLIEVAQCLSRLPPLSGRLAVSPMYEPLNLAIPGVFREQLAIQYDGCIFPAPRYDRRWWRWLRVSETPTLSPREQGAQKQLSGPESLVAVLPHGCSACRAAAVHLGPLLWRPSAVVYAAGRGLKPRPGDVQMTETQSMTLPPTAHFLKETTSRTVSC
jgi:hypothetical protein